MNWYFAVLKNYINFNGRARRKEYWMFALFNIIFVLGALALDNILGLTAEPLPYGPIYTIYALVLLLPGLAVAVRRLHDIGKSGAMILIALIPIIGAIWLLILMVKEGKSGENQYGLDPKEVLAA